MTEEIIYMDKLNLKIQELLTENTNLRKKNTLLYKEIYAEEEKTVEAQRIVDELQKQEKNLDKQVAFLQKKVKDQEKINCTLQKSIQAGLLREKELEQKIEQMENSKSWKLTSPLRKLLFQIQKLM